MTAIFLATATMVNAGTEIYLSCIETNEAAVAFYLDVDFAYINKLIEEGASVETVGGAIGAMVAGGRAINTYKMRISGVVVVDNIAHGKIPDGTKVWTFSHSLRCE